MRKWKDKQLISENWVESAQKSSQAKSDYGYLWWNNSQKAWEGVSEEVYFAAGFGGNYIIIDEENDLLVVTRWIDNSKIDDVMRLLQKAVE